MSEHSLRAPLTPCPWHYCADCEMGYIRAAVQSESTRKEQGQGTYWPAEPLLLVDLASALALTFQTVFSE